MRRGESRITERKSELSLRCDIPTVSSASSDPVIFRGGDGGCIALWWSTPSDVLASYDTVLDGIRVSNVNDGNSEKRTTIKRLLHQCSATNRALSESGNR